MKILLIDNYDSFTYNLYHYLSSLKAKVDVIRNDKITSKEILNNHKEWLHEYKEWDKAPTEGNLIGETKKDSDNDTLH